MTAELACPLTAIPAPARPVAGGKAAALGELAAAGLPVPPGYVVTTAAFRRALAEIDPGQTIPAAIERLSGDDPGAVQAA
ncbi:MAG TPA: PEP/pyruvate-binding domain-containing protein, partial [Streptosporangiaceae bacterium]|nr:PEP/pyruvate-binding domain-containing protein [Streptosporangiaceae bacterium]